MVFRFLHLADLHLATSFGGVEATRARFRRAALEAFTAAVDLALERELHAVLVAGDLLDEGRLDPPVARFLVDEVERMTRAGCWFVYVTGNHDPGGKGGRVHDWLLADLDARAADQGAEGEAWRARVHVLRGVRPTRVTVLDPAGAPVGLVVGAGHPADRYGENLAAKLPQPEDLPEARGLPIVGLLHTQVVDGDVRQGEHERYAPCSVDDLRARPYAYWALGHVHRRGQVAADVPAWYCGNLLGRNPKPTECGPKGGLLVEAGAGAAAEPTFVRLGGLAWERVDLDLAAEDHAELRATAGREALLDGLEAAVRAALTDHDLPLARLALRLVPRGPLEGRRHLADAGEREDLARELAERLGCVELQLKPGRLHRPRDLAELAGGQTVLAQALGLRDRLVADPAALDELAADLRLPGLEGEDRAAYLLELLDGVEHELVERFLDPDAEATP